VQRQADKHGQRLSLSYGCLSRRPKEQSFVTAPVPSYSVIDSL
jgi:hypothetical protein